LTDWFARPVLFVTDVDRSVDFYVNQLGFTRAWRHEEDGKAIVAQVDRQGCALILSSQWPDKVGKGLMFISLNVDVAPDKLRAEAEAALDKLRIEFEGKGVNVADGYWGYRLVVVHDLDGNELYFPYPSNEEAPAADKA
jgi:catechol 2,3-dioxygenase-like lactoylglutathione lyase family enzyme